MLTKGLISLWNEKTVSGKTWQDIETLQDLIRVRLPKLGLEGSLEKLRPSAWEIRLQAADHLLKAGSIYDMLPLQEIAREYEQEQADDFSEHSQYALEIYSKTILGILEPARETGELSDLQIPPDFDLPYPTIAQLENVPQWPVQYLGRWITVSIDLDLLLLMLDLHRQEALIPDKAAFIRRLRTTVEYFGAYAAVLGFWKIGYAASQAITNTRIVSGILQASTDKISRPFSISELKDRYNSLAG